MRGNGAAFAPVREMLMAQQPVELILIRQWASYLTMPIFVIGADGLLAYYNEPAEALLGRTFDEVGEVALTEVSSMWELTDETGGGMELSDFPLGVAWLEHRPAHGRVRYRGLDGTWRLVDVTAIPIEGHDERHLGAIAIFWEANSH
jgi:PAS domain-containing protein